MTRPGPARTRSLLLAVTAAAGLLAGTPSSPPAQAATGAVLPLAGFADVVVDDAHGHVFLSGGSSNTVLVRTLDGGAVTTITGQDGARQMALSEDGTRLYVALRTGDAVSAIDTTTLRQVARYSTGSVSCPSGVAVTGGRVWFGHGCNSTGHLGVLDPSTPSGVRLGTKPDQTFSDAPLLHSSPTRPGRLLAGDPRTSRNPVQVLDVRGEQPVVVGTADTGGFYRDAAFTADGTRAVLATGSPYHVPVHALDDLAADGALQTGDRGPVVVATSTRGMVAAGFQNGENHHLTIYRADRSPARTYGFGYAFGQGASTQLAEAGLAFNAAGTRLYAVTTDYVGKAVVLHVLDVDPAPLFDDPQTLHPVLGRPATLAGSAGGPAREPGADVQVFARKRGQASYVRTADLVADERGRFTATYVPDDDYRFYVQVGGRRSASVLRQASPTIAGPARRVVPKGSTYVLTGRGTPGSTVHLSFRRSTDLESYYPVKRQVQVGADGIWHRSVLASQDYRLYVARDALQVPLRTVLVQAR